MCVRTSVCICGFLIKDLELFLFKASSLPMSIVKSAIHITLNETKHLVSLRDIKYALIKIFVISDCCANLLLGAVLSFFLGAVVCSAGVVIPSAGTIWFPVLEHLYVWVSGVSTKPFSSGSTFYVTMRAH